MFLNVSILLVKQLINLLIFKKDIKKHKKVEKLKYTTA